MASASGRGAASRAPCRAFFRGSCRWGTNCRFSHEKSIPVCRHFQNGFCAYGDKCSFLHLLPCPRSDSPSRHLASRRVSEPCLMPCVPNPQVSRRVSEPSVTPLQSAAFENRRVPENWALAAEFVPRNTDLVRSISSPILVDKTKTKEIKWQDETQHRTSLKIHHSKMEDKSFQYERSRDVVCGICMDKVYDKQMAEERIFGILPNCSHAYCVGCIKQWRKTRDFQNEVIKGCPQCRVKSSYFIPYKYWIGDSDEKIQLIEDFKAKTSKIRCRFFLRSNGYCPFKSDCIYLHDLPHGHQRHRKKDQRRASASALSYSQLVGIYEEDFREEEEIDLLHCALTLALIEDRFELGLGFPEEVEIVLGECSDSE
ncbi:probable E3 ubiquitin-protein ligase makorin-2 [Bufo bufo]|uniref:probable E3 ubiquitin-protein ligase makorin-2 n=1 Tax=Bufo bufo TaxID=8384 RepID=UPI001ABDBB70|nr:probable E3 ubiquitin-protein ligase makorin-2 [Bufo bufo]